MSLLSYFIRKFINSIWVFLLLFLEGLWLGVAYNAQDFSAFEDKDIQNLPSRRSAATERLTFISKTFARNIFSIFTSYAWNRCMQVETELNVSLFNDSDSYKKSAWRGDFRFHRIQVTARYVTIFCLYADWMSHFSRRLYIFLIRLLLRSMTFPRRISGILVRRIIFFFLAKHDNLLDHLFSVFC